jgi:hypothetical protein
LDVVTAVTYDHYNQIDYKHSLAILQCRSLIATRQRIGAGKTRASDLVAADAKSIRAHVAAVESRDHGRAGER